LIQLIARWCQPCRVLTPLLKGVTGPETEYDLMTLDVDQHPDLAAEYKVDYLYIRKEERLMIGLGSTYCCCFQEWKGR
jgi:hypothetical protein